MRILQVVTYISPDGAYGGPVRVALNQAKALRDLGHEVIVAAAAGGFDGPLPEEFDGFPVHLFPGRRVLPKAGFAGLTSPGLLAWLVTAVKGADVVHVHLARDLVTLPGGAIALLAGKPLVVQTHGMIDRTDKMLAKPLDALMTVPALRGAASVLHLTGQERDDLVDVAGPDLPLVSMPNGVGIPSLPSVEQTHGPFGDPEVLCLARLHPIKRPLTFVRAGINLNAKFPDARFTLVGPDEGEGAVVKAAIRDGACEDKVRWDGPIAPGNTAERMRRASIFALPSESELFSMATLEAMSLGLPVVITETCGLASLVREKQAGIVCDLTQADFERSLEQLLQDADLRRRMGANGRRTVESEYSMDSVGHILSRIYQGAKTN